MSAFARYIVAGGSAFAVHLAVLELLLTAGVAPAFLASAAGFVVACVVNYSLQRVWVFRSGRGLVDSAVRYAGVTVVMLAVNTALFALLQAGLGLSPALAQTFATGGVFVLNFFCNRSFTFGVARHS